MQSAGTPEMNVLVVEKAAEIRVRLIEMLRAVAGVQSIEEADSISDALAEGLDRRADALLLDLQPTGGVGLELLARLKQARPALRVIVLTNFASPQYRQASLAAGADRCLDKSREFSLVPMILRDWIEAAHNRPAA
jgi:two-component system, NarL family, response regulator DevR